MSAFINRSRCSFPIKLFMLTGGIWCIQLLARRKLKSLCSPARMQWHALLPWIHDSSLLGKLTVDFSVSIAYLVPIYISRASTFLISISIVSNHSTFLCFSRGMNDSAPLLHSLVTMTVFTILLLRGTIRHAFTSKSRNTLKYTINVALININWADVIHV